MSFLLQSCLCWRFVHEERLGHNYVSFFISAVYWMGYEILKSKFTDPGFAASFSSGAVSGAVSVPRKCDNNNTKW